MSFVKLCSNPAIRLNIQSASKRLASTVTASAHDVMKSNGDVGTLTKLKNGSEVLHRDENYSLRSDEVEGAQISEHDTLPLQKKFAKKEWKAKEWNFVVDDNKPVYEGVARKLGYRVYGDGFQKI